MARLNLNDIEPAQFGPIPEGKYNATVSNLEEKTSKTGDLYLKLEFSLIDSIYPGRKVWQNLNINHSDEKVRMIALSQLKLLALKTGQTNLNDFDTDQLLGKTLSIKVAISREGYNEVKGYYDYQKPSFTNQKTSTLPNPIKEDDDIPF